MTIIWQDIAKKTVLSPKEAAGEIIQLRRLLSVELLWSMVVLVAALMAMSYWVQWQWFPPMPPETPQQEAIQKLMERIATRPLLAATLSACGIVVLINALHWTGRLFGGNGSLHDMAAVFLWLQFFLITTGALTLVLALVAIQLAALVSLVVNILGMWILIAFIDRVHGFNNPMKSLGVLVMSVALLLVGFIVFSLIIALSGAGVPAHV